MRMKQIPPHLRSILGPIHGVLRAPVISTPPVEMELLKPVDP